MPTPTPEVHLTPETVEDAHQLRAVLTGIVGLLQHPHKVDDATAARAAALRASAIADRLCAHLDALAAIRLEQERAEYARREAQAQAHAGSLGVAR